MKLKSSWTFWYHDLNSNDWSRDSYHFIYTVSTSEELFGMLQLITPSHLKMGMYFIMLEDIFPEWSDPRNINGGYWSTKIMNNHQNSYQENLIKWILYMVEEEIYNPPKNDKSCEIQGISFSPKINHGILKLWNDNSSCNQVKFIHKNLNTTGTKYCPFKKKH